MTNVTNSEPKAEARERLAKAVENFDGTDEEARSLSNEVLLAMGWARELDEKNDCWFWSTPDGRYYTDSRSTKDVPHPLRNAQDALDLLPERIRIGFEQPVRSFDLCMAWTWWPSAVTDQFLGQLKADHEMRIFDHPSAKISYAKTIQAAITAAALRAG